MASVSRRFRNHAAMYPIQNACAVFPSSMDSSLIIPPPLQGCKMFDLTNVTCYQLIFSSFTTILHDQIIPNVNLHGWTSVLFNTSSDPCGAQIDYFCESSEVKSNRAESLTYASFLSYKNEYGFTQLSHTNWTKMGIKLGIKTLLSCHLQY